MPSQITTAFKNRYASNVYHVAQQKKSRLRRTVTLDPEAKGEKYFIDVYGKREPQEITDRHGDSPIIHQDHDRRMCVFKDWEDGEVIDNPDKFRTLDDPENDIVQAMSGGFGRKIDEVIYLAANATAYSGKEGSTSNTLAAANKVAKDYVEKGTATDSGLTVGKVRRASAILNGYDVDEEDRFIIIGSNQLHDMLREDEATSGDYAGDIKALIAGEIRYFLGFTWIRISNDILTKNTSTLVRTCFAWQRSGIKYGFPKEPKVEMIAKHPGKRFNPYVYNCMTIGAVRMEEKKVVEISCVEAS